LMEQRSLCARVNLAHRLTALIPAQSHSHKHQRQRQQNQRKKQNRTKTTKGTEDIFKRLQTQLQQLNKKV
jgi:septal ring factor EnvC (AmiA/AmiB activator)